MQLKAGTPLSVLAANTDTSMNYVEDHYFHYKADEATDIPSKSRKILKTATEDIATTNN